MERINLESQRQCSKQNGEAGLFQGFIIPHALNHTYYESICMRHCEVSTLCLSHSLPELNAYLNIAAILLPFLCDDKFADGKLRIDFIPGEFMPCTSNIDNVPPKYAASVYTNKDIFDPLKNR